MSGRCAQEEHVLRAAARGEWNESLRAHVAGCADCAAAAETAPWLTQFASLDDREHLLPDPSIVWLKAKLLRDAVAAERVARPMTIVQMSAYVIVAACWAALLTWKWGAIQEWLLRFTPTGFLQGISGSGATQLSMTFFATVFVLSSATVMLALHTILAED